MNNTSALPANVIGVVPIPGGLVLACPVTGLPYTARLATYSSYYGCCPACGVSHSQLRPAFQQALGEARR